MVSAMIAQLPARSNEQKNSLCSWKLNKENFAPSNFFCRAESAPSARHLEIIARNMPLLTELKTF
jgi:hypothetical protein